jgi:hypothetical protein
MKIKTFSIIFLFAKVLHTARQRSEGFFREHRISACCVTKDVNVELPAVGAA